MKYFKNKKYNCVIVIIIFAFFLVFSPLFAAEGTETLSLLEINSAHSSFQLISENKSKLKSHVQCSLSLEKYHFFIDVMPGDSSNEQDHSFLALFKLSNKSGESIQFELISHCGETKPVQFVLKDEEGETIWSYILINPLLGCPDKLENWLLANNTIFYFWVTVPLIIERQLLEKGTYTLEAFIDGTPTYGAYTPFRIDYAY